VVGQTKAGISTILLQDMCTPIASDLHHRMKQVKASQFKSVSERKIEKGGLLTQKGGFVGYSVP
jgi:hypothetical protein